MIRLGKMSDLDQILNLVEEAKELMKEHDNEQWDDQYPLLEHFEEDIAKDYLYVLEENDKIFMALLLSTKTKQNGMMTLTGQ